MLSDRELINIKGGATSAAFINAIVSIFTKLFNLGQAFGSAISRSKTNTYCS